MTKLSDSIGAAAAPGSSDSALVIQKYDPRAATSGSPLYFTGSVTLETPFRAEAPARVGGATVHFEAGARTAWHTHPLGQTLIVTLGSGLVQELGGPIGEIAPGDVVWIAPGVKHWHGAKPSSAMTHVAIAEALDGKTVDWLELVSDDQYRGQDC